MRAISWFSMRGLRAGARLLPEDVGEDERRNDRSVGFGDKARRIAVELAPGNFFVGHRAAVGAVGGGAVGDLAEVAPQATLFAQVLGDQRHHANGEVPGNASADLEKAY